MSSRPAPNRPAFRFDSILEKQSEAEKLAAEFSGRWEQGEPITVEQFLQQHPDLAECRLVVMNLLYEEFANRMDAGQAPRPEEFIQRFPHYAQSIRRQFAVEGWMDTGQNMPLPPAWPTCGEELHGCRLVGELGRGAFARVYLARERALGDRFVALKFSPNQTDEAQTLGRLGGHENIVTVHWMKPAERLGLNVVCMEFAGNVTLADLFEQLTTNGRPLPQSSTEILQALRNGHDDAESAKVLNNPAHPLASGTYIQAVLHIGRQLALALAHTHAGGVYHLDLKPSNVLIAPNGTAKLLDFNLAFDPRVAARRMGGTLPYMAPEQLRAMMTSTKEKLEIGERSDVFSLGVILYEMLGGKHPFGDIAPDMKFEQLRDHLLERHPRGAIPLASVNRSVDATLARLIESCLAVDPERRPESAAVLAEGLRKAWLLEKGRKRRRQALIAGIGGILALPGVIYGLTPRTLTPQEYAELGYQAFQEQRFTDAVECFSEALKSDEKNPSLLYARGRAHESVNDLPAAIDDFGQASDFDESGFEAPSRAAYLIEKSRGEMTGVDGTAVFYGERAVTVGGTSIEMYNNLGFSQMQEEQYEKAEENLWAALKLDSTSDTALSNLAAALCQRANRGTIVRAEEWNRFQQILQQHPRNLHVYLDAAKLVLASDIPNQEKETAALDLIRRVVAAGIDPTIINERLFADSNNRREFQRLTSGLKKSANEQSPPEKLLDPPTDGSGIASRFPPRVSKGIGIARASRR